jgi:LysM repeat protein
MTVSKLTEDAGLTEAAIKMDEDIDSKKLQAGTSNKAL